MELASMLAGEPFSDRPTSVCPVVGSVLRSYNDSVDDAARQELYSYASRVVGSRASAEVQEARSDYLLAWTRGLQRRRWSRLVLRWRLWPMAVPQQADVVAAIGVHTFLRQREQPHTEILGLVDELLAITTTEPPIRPEADVQTDAPAVAFTPHPIGVRKPELTDRKL